MNLSATCRDYVCFLAVLIAMAGYGVGLAQELALSAPRSAYWRGETIPLSVAASGAVAKGDLRVSLDQMPGLTVPFDGKSAKVAVPTADVKVGTYVLKAAVGGVAATMSVTVARRPASERLEIWLWGTGGGDYAYYHDHGFTIAGGPNWTYWKDADRATHIQQLDNKLAQGVYATIGPCGGIQRRDVKGVNPEADDVAYKGAGRRGEEILNPFSPEVERVRRESNQKLMEAIGDHPAAKMAFYNTELVDNLWLDNLNRGGIELTQRKLGFTRDQRGQPKFVSPGVIADDDRGYLFLKHVYKEGNGLSYANRKTAEDIKRYRPDVWTVTDPYRQVTFLDMFPGLDAVETWTYTNNDPKLMLYIETLRALTRGTKQMPLQMVTLLNYPGMLAPKSATAESSAQRVLDKPDHAGWMLMGPDRCKEVSWIILSRAPKIIGYYYSSACNPQKYNRPEDQFYVPHATSDAIQELSDRVFRPYGQMITRLDVAKRRIAVLSSHAARLYGKSPRTIGYPNEQIYAFYSVMAMAHLNGDVLFDEHVEKGALKDYDVLALPKCDVVTKTMHDEMVKFAQRGGIIFSDQYLGPDIPGAIKFDFDFTYRPKVNADAIERGVMYAEWDDHLNPKTAALAAAKGVTAEDDQKIMESYARRLKQVLAGKVEPEVYADSPKALVNVLEKHGVKYLALINDCRAYDDRTGKYKAIMEKLVPQTVTVTLREWDGPLHAYDMLEKRAIPTARQGKSCSFRAELTELGGKLIALYPSRLAGLDVAIPDAAKRGGKSAISVTLKDESGRNVPGLQPLRIAITDPKGNATEHSDYFCAENGTLTLPFNPALNDEAGTWKVSVEDLTAGVSVARTFQVR